jgi:uncharacterized protein YbbC (DUF1343 family)
MTRKLFNRRAVLHGLGLVAASGLAMPSTAAANVVTTGAASLAAAKFAALDGRRVGLITNHTGRVGDEHLADLLSRQGRVRLTAILAPEHGFRGMVEAGEKVGSARDPKTGVPVHSLYGATRKPTAAMLRDVDCLAFDIQDVGVRFYTYISTMGLAMQAAASARIPFFVFDRPNPLGGDDVSGFVMEPAFKSFVGQYPMPIMHGMTVGESLDLTVVPMQGWRRPMRWPQTGLPWIATSPNIPSFESALAYPGIGIVGETLVNEGRGTPIPFSQFGAPWIDANAMAGKLNALRLPGVRFEATQYTPKSIPNVAAHPRFEGQRINAVRLAITEVAAYRPLEVGMHALALLRDAARAANTPMLDKFDMFQKIAGTKRLHQMLDQGASGTQITAAWTDEVARFRKLRAQYLMY